MPVGHTDTPSALTVTPKITPLSPLKGGCTSVLLLGLARETWKDPTTTKEQVGAFIDTLAWRQQNGVDSITVDGVPERIFTVSGPDFLGTFDESKLPENVEVYTR